MNLINILKYSYIQARIKYLLVNFLDEEKYEEIKRINQIEELFEKLNNTIYKKIFEEKTKLNYSILSKKINYFHYELTKYLLNYLRGEVKNLFLLIIEKYDIEKLFLIIRKNIKGKKDLEKLNNPENIINEISKENYINKQNIEKKIKEYQEQINQIKNKEEGNIIFYLEKSIIENYYKKLIKQINKFSRKEKEIIWQFIGVEIDFEKLLLALRIKFFYPQIVNKIENYLLSIEYQIKNKEIKKILEEEKEIIDNLNKKILIKYKIEIKDEEDKNKILEQIAEIYDKKLEKLIRKTFLYNQFSFGIILAFLYKLKRDYKLITQKIKEIELNR